MAASGTALVAATQGRWTLPGADAECSLSLSLPALMQSVCTGDARSADRHRPHSVRVMSQLLLLDEFEKAHREVATLLLQARSNPCFFPDLKGDSALFRRARRCLCSAVIAAASRACSRCKHGCFDSWFAARFPFF
eukprot:1978345-Pleurochrysis_carterae.AAC.4